MSLFPSDVCKDWKGMVCWVNKLEGCVEVGAARMGFGVLEDTYRSTRMDKLRQKNYKQDRGRPVTLILPHIHWKYLR
jgi:hypothetical protein